MTIAAGFSYQGGILLCADTQHEAGAAKTYSAKIGMIHCPFGDIGYAYAGHTEFALSAKEHCAKKLKTISDPDRVIPELERILAREYRKTVYTHPDRLTDGMIQYSLLFSVRTKTSETWLYSAHETALHEEPEVKCIGLGSDVANSIMRSTYTPHLTEAQAIYLATYALSQVCKYVPGCGGPLHILVLRSNGTSDFISPHKIAAIQAATEDFEVRAQRLLYAALNQQMPDNAFEQEVKSFGGWLGKRRTEFRKATVQYPQPTTAAQLPPQP